MNALPHEQTCTGYYHPELDIMGFMFKDQTKIVMICCLVVMVLVAQKAPGSDAEAVIIPGDKGYVYDPTISGGENLESLSNGSHSSKFEKKKNQTTLQLETENSISPYIGAIKPDPVPQDLQPFIGRNELRSSKMYKLETGLGISVNDTTDFSLGYRFNDPPSLLQEGNQATDDQFGQLRFGLDLKIPFE